MSTRKLNKIKEEVLSHHRWLVRELRAIIKIQNKLIFADLELTEIRTRIDESKKIIQIILKCEV